MQVLHISLGLDSTLFLIILEFLLLPRVSLRGDFDSGRSGASYQRLLLGKLQKHFPLR